MARADDLNRWAQQPYFFMAEGNYPFPSTYITFSVTTGAATDPDPEPKPQPKPNPHQVNTGAATPLPLPLTLTLSLTLTR